MVMHGDDILVTTNIGGTQAAIAACKSCSFDIRRNYLSTCSPTSGVAKKKVPTDYEWSVSCDCLITNPQYTKQLLNALIDGTELTLQFILGGFKIVGNAFVKSWKPNGAKGNLANLSVQFEGSEEIDTDSEGWDYINGKLYTYSTVLPGLINNTGILMMQGKVDENGVLKYQRSRPTPAMAPSES